VAGSSLQASLDNVRFEIVPARGVTAQLDHLPGGAVVTVTASPSRGIDGTLAVTAEIRARGHPTVPHLAARLVTGPDHLHRILDMLEDAGIDDAFVVAGDARQPAGPYEGAADLLAEMARMGHRLRRIGITGYPERHAFIPDAVTIEAMRRKAPFASYIVSQICYDPAVIRGWIEAVRTRGIDLPIYIGLPGAVDRSRLLRLSARVGLGDSVRFLRRQSEVAGHALAGYRPDDLVHGLADLVGDPQAGVRGWHLFTFNEIEQTEQWRQELLKTIAADAPRASGDQGGGR
jgi:methylenetetrahydrofolate reductase (NADPH)